jgi:hypothetical protein
MSNRFSWAWKLCTLGYPIALVYLGFIDATEMPSLFRQDDDWAQAGQGPQRSAIPFQDMGPEHRYRWSYFRAPHSHVIATFGMTPIRE